MNLIRNQVDIKRLLQKPNTTHKFSFKKLIAPVLLICVIISTFFIYSAQDSQVEAAPFGLGNDYEQIIALNEKAAKIVPLPVDTIGMTQNGGDKRVVALLIFLQKYHSPMASFPIAKAFVESADKNGFGDKWYLLPAISGMESGFGKVIPYSGKTSSYNGWGWSGGSKKSRWSYFASWEDAARRISAGVAKGYGLQNLTPERMMASYCPPCAKSGGRWAKVVNMYIAEMQGIYKGL